MRHNTFFILFILMFAIVSCSTEIESTNPFDPETPQINKAKGAISGKINPEDIRDLNNNNFSVSIPDSSYNAIVEKDGSFKLNDLPPGKYKIKVLSLDNSYKEEEIGPFEVISGQTIFTGTIPLFLKKGSVTALFTYKTTDGKKSAAAYSSVFLGKINASKSENLLFLTGQDRCSNFQEEDGYQYNTDGSGKLILHNLRVGKYKAVLSDRDTGFGFSNEFVVEENKMTDIGEIEVATPSALLHIEDPSVPGIAIDVTSQDKIRLVFGLNGFSGDVKVAEGENPDIDNWKNISATNYADITLSGEGSLTISAKFRDFFCRESPIFKTRIFRDIKRPEIIDIKIDDIISANDYLYSRSPTLKIHLNVSDNYHNFISDFSAMKMKVTAENPDEEEWEDFNTVKDIFLGESDGNRLIKFLLKDKAGNISEIITKGIILDRTPPQNVSMNIYGKILDTSGILTDNQAVTYLPFARFTFNSDSQGGKVYLYEDMGINPPSCDLIAEPRKIIPLTKEGDGSIAETDIELSGSSEEKRFFACFTDLAENIRTTPITQKIFLDRTAPTNVFFTINDGSQYSNNNIVKLTSISASDNYQGQLYIKVSNCPDFKDSNECNTTEWLNFTSELNWDTGLNEGKREIFLKVRDFAGNESPISYSSINIDLTDPEPPTDLGVSGNNDNGVIYVNTIMPILKWSSSASQDIDYYEIHFKRIDENNFTVVKANGVSYMLPSLSEGRYNFKIKAVDKAGRESSFVDGPDFVIDITAPTTPRLEKLPYSIIDLPDSTNNELKVKLSVLSTDTNFMEYRIKGGINSEFKKTELNTFNQVRFNLIKDSTNNLQIKAVDKAGNESSIDFIIITEDSKIPFPPSNIQIIEGNGKVHISWNPSSSKDVAGYKLYYGFTNNPPYSGSFAAEGISPIDVGMNTKFGLSSLINFSKFYVTVTAYDKTENVLHESIMPPPAEVNPTPISIEKINTYTDNHTPYKIYINNNLLAVIDNEGIRLLDLSNPQNPSQLAFYKDNQHIYAAAQYKDILLLAKDGYIDIVDIQKDPQLYKRIATGYTYTNIMVKGDFIIAPTFKDGVHFYSFTDEYSIDEVNVWGQSEKILASFLEYDYLYLVTTTDYSKYTLKIVNVANIESPNLEGEYNIGGYCSALTVEEGRVYAVITAGFLVTKLIVLDASQPTDIKPLGEYTGNMINGVITRRRNAFIIDSTKGLIALDLSKLPEIREISNIENAKYASDLGRFEDYIYLAGGTNGLMIIDISNTNEMKLLKDENIEIFYPKDVIVQGAYAYTLNNGYPKMEILDISNPLNVVKKSELVLKGSGEGFFISGNLIFIAENNKGMEIVDVSNPSEPDVIGELSGVTPKKLYYKNGYIFGIGGTSFYSIEVNDPKKPVLLKSISVLSDPKDILVRGSAAYIADGMYGLKVIDINNPSEPKLIKTHTIGENIVGVQIAGKKLILADESKGVWILEVDNIENPSNINQIGNFIIRGITKDIAISGSFVYVLSVVSGIWVLDISNPREDITCPDAIYCKGFLEISNSENRKMSINGTMLYVAQLYNGLEIYEIAYPTVPVKLGEITMSPMSYALQNGHLFLLDSTSLMTYNILDPQNPIYLKTMSNFISNPNDLAVVNNLIYIAEYNDLSSIIVVDATDPSNPHLSSLGSSYCRATKISIFGRTIFLSCPTSFMIIDSITFQTLATLTSYNNQKIVQQGRYIYVPTWRDGVDIYDISDRTNPNKISNIPTTGAAVSVFVYGDIAYIAGGDEGLIIVDISDKTKPVKIGNYPVSSAYDVVVYGNIAYLGSLNQGFLAIDVSDPQNPYLIAKYQPYSNLDRISVSGNNAYLQTRSGIEILNLEP